MNCSGCGFSVQVAQQPVSSHTSQADATAKGGPGKNKSLRKSPIATPPAGQAKTADNAYDAKKQRANEYSTKGHVSFADKNYDQAIMWYTRAIETLPLDSTAYANRAAAFVEQRQYSLAEADCQHAINLQERNPPAKAHVLSARCRYACGRPIEALAFIRRALDLEPENGMAKALRAKAKALRDQIHCFEGARARGDWELARTARDNCMRAVLAEGGVPPAQWKCWAVELHIACGDFEMASAFIEHQPAKPPVGEDVMLLRGLVLFLVGKLDESLELLAGAVHAYPRSQKIPRLLFRVNKIKNLKNEGDVCARAKRWAPAIEKYDKALEEIGQHSSEAKGGRVRAQFLCTRAAFYIEDQRIGDAKADIEASLLLYPSNYAPFYIRGLLHMQEGNYEAAIQEFKLAKDKAAPGPLKALMESRLREAEAQRSAGTPSDGLPTDHYEILGLSRECTEAEIKKAYRQAALKHHPDKGGNEETFKRVLEAYTILSDPVVREAYDAKIIGMFRGNGFHASNHPSQSQKR
ncbi:TPR-like protein [Dentipellis sp. KUC8613]|nr:TPR-like protein [Dentipellis sp. KUC8613]